MNRTILLGALLLVLAARIAWGQIPQTISYQGVLTDATGKIVTDGNYSLTFKLYDLATGGSAVWSESQSVAVSKGIFNVLLGSATALALPFDKPYWLGTTVGSGAELTPRSRLTSAPYSLNASKVKGSTNIFPSEGNVGVGTTTPGAKLDVNGNIYLTSGGGTVRISGNSDWRGYFTNIVNGNTIGSYLTCGGSFSHNGATLSSVGDWNSTTNRAALAIYNEFNSDWHNEFRFLSDAGSGTPDTWMILRGGNVGIGTASPAEKLQVAGTIYSSQGGIKFPDGTVQTTASTSGGGTGLQGIQNTNNTLDITNPNGPTATVNVKNGGIAAQQLADGAVTTAKLAVGGVTSGNIGGGQVVKSLNSLKDDVTLAAGSNITITPSGNTLTIASAAGSAFRSVYTVFGLSSGSSSVGTAWTNIESHSFTKYRADTKIEVILNSRIWTFTTGTVLVEVRVDGQETTIQNLGSVISPEDPQFNSIFAVFDGLSAGAHTVSAWARVSLGTTNLVGFSGSNYGGAIIVKETM